MKIFGKKKKSKLFLKWGGGGGERDGVKGRRGPKGIVHFVCVRVKNASIK